MVIENHDLKSANLHRKFESENVSALSYLFLCVSTMEVSFSLFLFYILNETAVVLVWPVSFQSICLSVSLFLIYLSVFLFLIFCLCLCFLFVCLGLCFFFGNLCLCSSFVCLYLCFLFGCLCLCFSLRFFSSSDDVCCLQNNFCFLSPDVISGMCASILSLLLLFPNLTRFTDENFIFVFSSNVHLREPIVS